MDQLLLLRATPTDPHTQVNKANQEGVILFHTFCFLKTIAQACLKLLIFLLILLNAVDYRLDHHAGFTLCVYVCYISVQVPPFIILHTLYLGF